MTLAPPSPNRLVLPATWADYLKFIEAVGERPNVRMTYDRGTLEIMTTSPEHEREKKFLGTLLETVLIELERDYMPGGSMTFRREDLGRGLEPDECYWIDRFEEVRDFDSYDPTVHPPPDLVLEVDITSSSLNRIEMYRSMGVPEVWRYRRTGMEVLRLGPKGYETGGESVVLPELPMGQLSLRMQQAHQESLTRATRALREWLRS